MRTKAKPPSLAIRVCPESGGIYLGLRENLRVVRTEVRQQWPLVAVDYARDGRVVGIEAVGMNPVRLDLMLQIARVKVASSALRRATIRQVSRRVDAVSA